MDILFMVLAAVFTYTASVSSQPLVVNLCSNDRFTTHLKTDLSIVIDFNTELFTSEQLPIACNASIHSPTNLEFVLSNYVVRFNNTDGLQKQTDGEELQSALKYWRCLGLFCENVTILQQTDLVYFHQKKDLRFYLEYDFLSPRDLQNQERKDIAGRFILNFPEQMTLQVTTVNVNDPGVRDGGQPKRNDKQIQLSKKSDSLEGKLKYILPIVIPVVIAVIVILVVLLSRRRTKRAPQAQQCAPPPPYVAADNPEMNACAAVNNAANLSKEMLFKDGLPQQDMVHMRDIPPPCYCELPSENIEKVPLDGNGTGTTNYTNDTKQGDFTVMLHLPEDAAATAPIVGYFPHSTTQPPAYDNLTYASPEDLHHGEKEALK